MIREHPDANQLAAFAERKLLREERQEIVAHLADCPDCREVVALASASAEQSVSKHPALLWWRVASAVGAMALIIAATWGVRLAIRSPEKTVPQITAALKSPATANLSAPALPEIAHVPAKPQAVHHKALAPKRVLAPAPSQAAPLTSHAVARPSPQLLADSTPRFKDAGATFTSLPAAWRVNSGSIERSLDSGKTWEPTPVDENVTFQAIEADGLDVWAGGSNGMLFHSPDGGSHWSRLQVRDAAGYLRGTIVTIRLPRPSEIVLETDSGEEWISGRNGLDWRRL